MTPAVIKLTIAYFLTVITTHAIVIDHKMETITKNEKLMEIKNNHHTGPYKSVSF